MIRSKWSGWSAPANGCSAGIPRACASASAWRRRLSVIENPHTGRTHHQTDPIARKEIRDILIELRDRGKTLLISSHELLEVEMISNRIGILFDGVLQTVGTLEELLVQRDMVLDVDGLEGEGLPDIGHPGVGFEDRIGTRAKLRVDASLSTYEVMELCKSRSLRILSIAPRRETLEELFVRVVGAAEAARRTN